MNGRFGWGKAMRRGMLALLWVTALSDRAFSITLLHEFAGSKNDGASPYGSLIQSGSALYGMTYGGGDYNRGTIFSSGTNGSGFTLLHEFAGGGNDGAYSCGSLIQSGSTLYGMTRYGGDSNLGTIFSLPIPEPSAVLLALLGAGVAALRRKVRAKASAR